MLTGIVDFEGQKCVFKLNEYILEVEEIENRNEFSFEDIEKIFGDTRKERPNIIRGVEFQNGYEILFFIQNNISKGIKNSVFKLSHYITFLDGESDFDLLRVTSKELVSIALLFSRNSTVENSLF